MRTGEWERFLERHPAACLHPGAPSPTVGVADVVLPSGWSTDIVNIWFLIPVGYPGAKPDCFWATSELRLSSGALPTNSGLQEVPNVGLPGLWFSWHLGSWSPSGDDLNTFFRFILRRFDDAR